MRRATILSEAIDALQKELEIELLGEPDTSEPAELRMTYAAPACGSQYVEILNLPPGRLLNVQFECDKCNQIHHAPVRLMPSDDPRIRK